MTLAEDIFALSQATQDERNVMNRDEAHNCS